MKRMASSLMGFFVLLSLSFYTSDLYSAPYYQGKTIKLIVGAGIGGGYDRMARVVAKNLPKYIPGKPSVVVENMPGANGIFAANQLYNNEKPDGCTIEGALRAIPFPQLLNAKAVKYDVRKFAWIGSMAEEAVVFAIRSELPYKTADDLRKAKGPIYMGVTGPQETTTQFAIFLKEFVRLNLSMVSYQSGNEAMMAIERKEADARTGSYSSLRPLIERGVLRPLIRGRASDPEIDNLPVNEDLTDDKMGKTIMAMHSVVDRIGRPYVAPPGTPAKVVAILRDAFAKMANDPEAQEESKRFMMKVKFTPAEECIKIVNYLFNQPDNVLKEFGKYVKL